MNKQNIGWVTRAGIGLVLAVNGMTLLTWPFWAIILLLAVEDLIKGH